MNKNYIKYLLALPLALLCLSSCNDFLDEMPDNRAEIDSQEKVNKLLVEAYPLNGYIMCTELLSDNVDDFGANNPYVERIEMQLYNWMDVTESDNEAPDAIWEACYLAIAHANQALQAIDEMGNPESLNPARGEALVCRAYAHFILVNVFCQHYSPEYSATDLGIPYMEAAETELNPKYQRGTVEKVYELIEKDLVEGLPLIDDASYTVPKYHFNQKAAYTFAARFYLFYQKWDEAIKCATTALGPVPGENLRDYALLASFPRDMGVVGQQFTSTSLKTNFLLQTGYSSLGLIFGPYYYGCRYNHGNILAQFETMNQAPWGVMATSTYDYAQMYILKPYVYAATNLDKTLLPRLPYLFEYSDPVAGIGYYRTVYASLTAEEALLIRAEANILKGDFTAALADMNIWTANTLNPERCNPVLTEEGIEEWANSYNYYTSKKPTPKKKLNPEFTGITLTEGSKQESFIHCLLYMRRHEFMHMGMRWFDVKRYGIEITRRTVEGLNVLSEDDVLELRDNRRALQLPKDVITAGMEANPR